MCRPLSTLLTYMSPRVARRSRRRRLVDPVGVVVSAVGDRCDLVTAESDWFREKGDVNAPFVLASTPRTRAIDDK